MKSFGFKFCWHKYVIIEVGAYTSKIKCLKCGKTKITMTDEKDTLPFPKISVVGDVLNTVPTVLHCSPGHNALQTQGRFVPEEEARRLWELDRCAKKGGVAIANLVEFRAQLEMSEKENANLKRQVEVLKNALRQYANEENYEGNDHEGFTLATFESAYDEYGGRDFCPWDIGVGELKKADEIAGEL